MTVQLRLTIKIVISQVLSRQICANSAKTMFLSGIMRDLSGLARSRIIMKINMIDDLAKDLYDRILRTANYFLHNCTHFSIDILAAENPSYEDVARIMESLRKILWAIADEFDPMMCQQAFDYCELMSKMGLAISNKDDKLLSEYVEVLKRKPMI